MAISSLGTSYQIIQSPVNRKRLEQQNQLSVDKQNEQKPSSIQERAVVKEKNSNSSSSDYESLKAQYNQLSDFKNSKIAAYKNVLNQESRENISSKLGISIYA